MLATWPACWVIWLKIICLSLQNPLLRGWPVVHFAQAQQLVNNNSPKQGLCPRLKIATIATKLTPLNSCFYS